MPYTPDPVTMNCSALHFAGHDFRARPSGVLYWPARQSLIVADLHLGKSGRMARQGGALLPPYDLEETLRRLHAELEATGATRLIALGDSFDDDLAAGELSPMLAPWLARLGEGREVIWVAGNHDPRPEGVTVEGDLCDGGLTLRHIAGEGPDISGHYHPKLTFMGQRIPVFLLGVDHLILPAFGTYTGGLDCDDPALRQLVPEGHAVLTGKVARRVPFPLPMRKTRRARSGFLLD